jgi:serine/threonine protein kinase
VSSDNQFGKYELLGRLAAGGMAEIFRARYSAAKGISKSVVIKRILPHYAANKQFIQMFTNEARIVMGLSHGNIAQVFDFGEIDGDWFLAMEYVDGQPLSKIIKRARTVGIQAIPTSFAVLISIEMLRGLHYAHTRLDDQGKPLKIVHRDVSPQNVLISYEGQIKLVDFGIAKARTAGRDETEGGAVKGKYSYFSPEQARGKELDARTDVFAAGIVLYEMLCGALPFQGRMIDTMSRIVKGQLTPPREMNPEITPALENIILTALATDREKRYPTAEAFQAALSSYLYQNAPSFQASTLGSFVQFLFEPDLVNDSRPVQLSRDFLDQVSLWKRPLPARPVEGTHDNETAWGKDPSRAGKRPFDTPSPPTDLAHRGGGPSKARYALFALPVLAGLFGAAGVFLYLKSGNFTVELSSSPSGATVAVDGREQSKVTPLVLELDAAQPHTIELSAAGMRDWSKTLQKERGDKLNLHAELTPLSTTEKQQLAEAEAEEHPDAGAQASAPEVKPATPPEPKPNGIAVVRQVTYPAQHFTISPEAHAFLVPKSKAARIKLNPTHTYRVSAEGKVSLGGSAAPIIVKQCVYFVEGAATARESFGLVGGKTTVTVRGTMLYAFFLDHAPDDNSGALTLHLKDGKGPGETLTVSATDNNVMLDPEERMSYNGVANVLSYDVTLKPGEKPAHTRGKAGGAVGKVLLTQAAGMSALEGKQVSEDAFRILEVGKTYKITGSSFLWLTFPDDDLSDNDGELNVDITAGTPGLFFKGLFPLPPGSSGFTPPKN